ncbi:phytoene desaturase [Nannocystis exedens]|uniref:Phytoene dehydrogenase n=1 Tax=Nannocystis exedens TaxID=54 RepID=A0A1I1VF34_9BACT|nr:phytoene desaturase [Nannocystis exedens]PCC72433.1 phytoene dehydrogenase [Nannocystis exedens]SFD79050.1 phytoene desaturase [Nannocystis exedens]
MSEQDRVIVIGSGLGGLAAAIRLRARGHEVLVLEAMDQPGGRAAVFEQDGFSFDAGPTVVTASHLFDELFALVGRERRDYVQFVPVDPFYRVLFPDGSRFDYVGDEPRILAQIEQFSPRDVDGYRRLAAQARQIFDIGYTELVDRPFDRFTDMLKIVPDLARLGCWRSMYEWVSASIEDERLRQVFTFQPLLIGGNPFRAPAIYALIHWLERKWGVEFAVGGTTAIVKAMVRLLGELGVEVRVSTPVAEIEVEGGRATAVRTAAGERLACAAVVSNADPATVYTKLVARRHRRWNSDFLIRRKKLSMGLFVGYFGADRTWPELAHHTIILGPRYRELLEDIFERKVLADDFSLYLHAPTRTDPNLAPPGCEAFYVLSPVPNTQAEGLDWDRLGEAYFAKIVDFLGEQHVPGLREHIVTRKHVTPRYFETELRSYGGAAFGPEPRLTQSAYFRYHNASEDVRGLYFVGAGTHPGAGMPGVLCSAKVLERVMPGPGRKGHVLRDMRGAAR